MSSATDLLYDALSLPDILNVVSSSPPEHLTSLQVSARTKRNKRLLIETLLKADPYWKEALFAASADKQAADLAARQARRVRDADWHRNTRATVRESLGSGSFLDLPSDADKLKCYQKFHDATSNDALRMLTCSVCARWLNARDFGVSQHPFDNLPNRHRLHPANPHPAHTLIDGCLLEPEGYCAGDNGYKVNVCRECYSDLESEKDQPPKYSLANNLWIGPVPWQLRCLTLAEQLLIARAYPRAFVVKLFPKDASKHTLRDDQLQSALRGNVTSFELNLDSISDMISGNIMPQPSNVLASVLSVTFVGRGNVPNPNALHLFRVRRDRVADALEWLKANNPKYYGDIVIDKARIAALPEDDVPFEVRVNIQHEPDVSAVLAESDSYVPSEDSDDGVHPEIVHSDDDTGPDVVPIQFLGVMDNDQTQLPTHEVMRWGLQNLCPQDEEPAYAVRYGQPVNTFGQPPQGAPPPDPARHNYWEKAFPMLCPYGVGGIESDRPVKLSYIDHVRWSLRYHDRRFRLHSSFIFVAFGIYQRRQVLASARVQMNRRDFDSVAHLLSTITPEDLKRAAEEEDRGQHPSNRAVQTLKRHINATSSRVFGSDSARFQYRNQIWTTSTCLNPPSLWITINPDDLHDPIAQILAKEAIDMDHFMRTAGPDKLRRSQNIAQDPFAAAEFFHFLITTILECLFGIKSTSSRVHSDTGVLGRVKGYFGTVECQGRGTLHLHMLLWLEGAPSPTKLKELLRTPEFRAKVVEYLKSNVRSFLPEISTQLQVDKEVSSDPEIAYSRLPNPSESPEQFLAALRDLELRVVRTKQMHKCAYGKCLRLDKHNRLTCKRRAPWELCVVDAVEEDGNYRTKRTLAFLNSYSPPVSTTAKCNNDIKLLLHGTGTNNITFYITGYIAKKQGKSYNASSLLAEGLLFHFDDKSAYADDLRERQRMLILRAVNVLNREQEVPGPLAVSYLMGWGDVYRSHYYRNIYWGTFRSLLMDTFDELKPKAAQHNSAQSEPNATDQGASSSNASTQHEVFNVNHEEEIVLQFNKSGRLQSKSQIDDYMYRGHDAADDNLLDYFTGTYEVPLKQRQTEPENTPHEPQPNIQHTHHNSNRGRPMQPRIAYLANHSRSATHVRVRRNRGHNSLPNLIGPRFPRRADRDQIDIYSASLLTLLKPWRTLADLKDPLQSWPEALEQFLAGQGQHIHDIVDSLEHYHTCRSAAEEDKQNAPEVVEADLDDDLEMTAADDPGPSSQTLTLKSTDITPAMVLQAKSEAENAREATHGAEAVAIGQTRGIFRSSNDGTVNQMVARATREELDALKNWQDLLSKQLGLDDARAPAHAPLDTGEVTVLGNSSTCKQNSAVEAIPTPMLESSIDPLDITNLYPEQRRAFEIIQWHMSQTLAWLNQPGTQRPPQLLMLMLGEGGTGKSRVIQTITAAFEKRGAAGLLLKAAYTGIAASLIDGKTTHNIGCISVGKDGLSNDGKKKLAKLWKDVRYLIIDECSMLSKTFFQKLSEHIAIAKLEFDQTIGDKPFGGVNVLVCGDFHQIPPVAAGKNPSLFNIPGNNDSLESKTGHKIYKEFNTVVVLRHQVRATDPIWRNFLGALRKGQIQEEHIRLLKSLVLTNPECRETDFRSDVWRNCSLVTPRHLTRMRWNDAAVAQHCADNRSQLFICLANDTIKNRPLKLHEQFIAAKSGTGRGGSRRGRKEKNGLPDEVPLAIGMKVMVTLNVQTDLDVANGARGTIVGIVLNPDEPPFDASARTVTLARLPPYVLVQLERTRAATLSGLAPGVIPIVPASKSYQIVLPVQQRNGEVTSVRRNVRRLQFPITPAYAFTDYRSQGQTIPSVVADIATPPTGGPLNLYNVYVALSRSSGCDTIRILRDFDERLLTQPLDYELARAEEDLDRRDAQTTEWWNQMRETHGLS